MDRSCLIFMDTNNNSFYLSIVKLTKKGGPNGKPWIRIEKVKDNE